ncbi:thiolase C-terminal domain-containing protein [Microbacterium sp. SLBN-146]|uniref:thiolase C-terminal domain-containing protein n=1 Tax=Microbacterium sp. SLBN-146 TaxID=2768457 RepID=UPI00114DECC9|nr:thiolase [Microbacterium sp. SLBN-146]TQJ29933.1 acetyl-CoA acetyltransferase [Microbacterium sp. SLBN-146]
MSLRGAVAIVGAAESTDLGRIPDKSALELHADAALNALADCGLTPADVDGVASAGEMPVDVADYLGIVPEYLDGTNVGGSSFMLHVRHAMAAIASGLCETVLVTHGESGRSRVGMVPWMPAPQSLMGQLEVPYGPVGAPSLFPIGVRQYMARYGMTREQLALVPVIQREWAALNPRAKLRDPITVEDVFASPVIADPVHLLHCCLVTDGGGALVLTSAERAKDLHPSPVYVLGAGESSESSVVSGLESLTSSRAIRMGGERAFAQSGIRHDDVDHLMIYDAFAHVPIYGLEDLGFVGRGEAPAFIEDRNTAPGGRLPLNTNGGGLSYTHTGMYGMFAIQESVRQVRGIAPAQVHGVDVSVATGVGGMFMSSGTLVLGSAATV